MKTGKIRKYTANSRIVNMNGRLYSRNALGQMTRIDPCGKDIPRVRMSKKKRLKLRGEPRKINEMDSHELADKIIETVKSVPAVNPKSNGQLNAENEKAGIGNA
jgi:predicted metalloprotease